MPNDHRFLIDTSLIGPQWPFESWVFIIRNKLEIDLTFTNFFVFDDILGGISPTKTYYTSN